MSEPSQFDFLAEIAGEKSDAAAKRLGNSLTQLRDSSARLELLERYREEYRRRLAAAGSHGLSTEDLRNWRNFLDKLEQAIAQQRAERDSMAQGVDHSRMHWLAARRREQSFGVLASRNV